VVSQIYKLAECDLAAVPQSTKLAKLNSKPDFSHRQQNRGALGALAPTKFMSFLEI